MHSPRPRPFENAQLPSVQSLASTQALPSKPVVHWPEPLPEQQLGFVCVSESMLDLLRVTRRVASSNITVLIAGETGTGKEMVARALHRLSPRREGPFVAVNCAALPHEIIEAVTEGMSHAQRRAILCNNVAALYHIGL